MSGYIEDRWLTKRKDPITGKRKRTERYGKGKRYRVAGIPGVRDRSFENLKDAQNWLNKASSKALEGEFVDPRRGEITLSEYVDQVWLPGKGGSVKTRKNIRNRLLHIRGQLGELPLRMIDAEVVRRFIAHLDDVLASSYGNSICSTLASILDTAVEDKRIPTNPTRSKSVVFPSKKNKEKREAWSADVVRAVRDAIHRRYRIAVVIGVGCGLRQGEAFGLSVDDIDVEAGVVHVRRQVQADAGRRYFKLPKGEKTRVVPLPPSVAAEVRSHLRDFPPVSVELPWGKPDAKERQKHALLMTSVYGNALDFATWNRASWKLALAAAGVIPEPPKDAGRLKHQAARKDGFHVLRHTFASAVLRGGEDVVTLSHWLGHESPTITFEHYAHFMPQSGRRGAAAVDALLHQPRAVAPRLLKLPTDSPAPLWKPSPDTKLHVIGHAERAPQVSPLVA